MMSEYYRNARTIRGACEMLAPRAGFAPVAQESEQLEAGIGLVDGELVLEQPDDLIDNPALALRIYVQAVERDRRIAASARRAIARATSSDAYCEALRKHPEAPALFRTLVCSIRDTHLENDSILGEMHDVGLLLAMFPEFSPVVGRVHHDTYHVYTVDVHSIAAVDHSRKLARGVCYKTIRWLVAWRPNKCGARYCFSRPCCTMSAKCLAASGMPNAVHSWPSRC